MCIRDSHREGAIVIKDRHGIRPAALGWKDSRFVAASEDVAIRKNGGMFIKDIEPGSVYYLYPDGKYDSELIVGADPRYCFFEWNYLADPESVINGVSVNNVQQRLGKELALYINSNADIVSFVPRRPEVAARAYADVLGLPFAHIMTKESALRSFQGPDQKERIEALERNMHLLDSPYFEKRSLVRDFRGAKVDWIDDSIIRGTVGSTVIPIIEPLGVTSRLLSYTPCIGKIRSDGVKTGCYDGVDMPPEESENHKFVARGRNFRSIGRKIGMEARALDARGMKSAFRKAGMDPNNLCTFCIGGCHPYREKS